jgi:DNA/RNA endonuclease G (NUC1)
MKRFYSIVIILFILATCFAVNLKTTAQNETHQIAAAPLVSPNIVISQFQVEGGTFNDEFIELHNISANSVDLNGLRLVYRSAAGVNDVLFINWTTSTIIPAGGYYLIASTGYDGSIVPNITYNPGTCSCSMSANGGGLAIRNGAGVILDSVGYGTATNVFIEGTKTNVPPNNGSQSRVNNGCQDTDNNSNDFSTVNPSAPRNSVSPANVCSGGGGTNLLAGGSASPNTVSPGGMTLLTVSVIPATTPPSTGITIFGNLTSIGGAANQQFYDDGINGGDVTANDNTFSYTATIPANASGGGRNITAIATDAQSRSANVSFNITINAPIAGEDHLLLGNPSNATPDVANENNYLMIKPQYALSYNRSRAIPNWVSWRLDSSWIGTAPRQDDFRPDSTLPAGWYQVTDGSYSGSGFDRGHHTPSGDRTRSIPDNSATFLMTNIMPQAGGNNQGPWNDLENYARSLATQGNELYIIAGGTGTGGIVSGTTVVNSIDGGRVTVPAQTWKVMLVLQNGDNDLSRINNNTRTIAVIMPNVESIRQDQWEEFVTSVDAVETLTGYDFFSNVAPEIQAVIESRVDGQANATPTINASSGITRQQGNLVSNSQIATVNDGNQTENTLTVTVNGGTSATVNGVTVSDISIDASGVVTANIVAAPGATAASFTLRVTDNQLSFTETTLNVAVTPGSFEADVASRPNGNGLIQSNDVVMMRQFLTSCSSIDTTTNEFQRADSAPLATKGDGLIQSNDVVQARRYITTDAPQTAGGPTAGCPGQFAAFDFMESAKTMQVAAPFGTTRQLSVESTTANPGGSVTVNIRVDAAGDESEYAFILNYQSPLSNPVVGNGTAGSLIRDCNVGVAGQVNCSVGGFSNNNPTSVNTGIGEIGAGNNQILITVTFAVAANATAGNAPLILSGVNASNDATELVVLASSDGAVTLAGQTIPKSRKRIRFI